MHAFPHAPQLFESVCSFTHVLPQSEVSPDTLLHAEVLVAGMQLSHMLLGLVAPLAYTVPPMSHCAPHAPATQMSASPQLVPSASVAHALVVVPGWQLWHSLFGLTAADA